MLAAIREAMQTDLVWWALGTAGGFVLAILILGEVIVRLQRTDRPMASTLRIVRSYVIPLAAGSLFLQRVVQLPDTHNLVRLAATAFWISVVHAALSLINDVVFAEAEEGTWQARVPKLLLDLIRGVLILIGAAVVLSTVWGFNLANLITALGVGSLVLGLALQEPLGNIFAGIMLLFERPVRIGDNIKIGDSSGRVVEINWRAVHIESGAGDLVVIPNAVLAKSTFINHSRPSPRHESSVQIGFSFDDPPNQVREVLRRVVDETPGVLADPRPSIRVASYGDFAIQYKVSFTVEHAGQVAAVKDRLVTRIWYAARREGLTMPYPTQTAISVEQSAVAASQAVNPFGLLTEFPAFCPKDPEVLRVVVEGLSVRDYGAGEVIVREGERLVGLHLISKGMVAIQARDLTGTTTAIGELERGEYFNEGRVPGGETSEWSYLAVEDCQLLVLSPNAVQMLFARAPRLASEVGRVLDHRRKAGRLARLGRGVSLDRPGKVP